MLGDTSAEVSEVSEVSISVAAGRLEQLDLAEKSGQMGDQDSGNENEDEDDNEFLNSSSFLSHSQIIRSTNVTNFKPSQPKTLSSPTRLETPPPTAQHFTKDRSSPMLYNALASDNEEPENINEDLGVYDDVSDVSSDHKSTKFIDIDDPRSTPKLPKMRPEATPWRRLRPVSSMQSRDPHQQNVNYMNYVQSLFDSQTPTMDVNSPIRSASLFEMGSMDGSLGSTGSITISEVEKLRKQVTNYKLQQKILTELIREILKRSGNGDQLKSEIMQRLEKDNAFLLGERDSLQVALKRGETEESAKYAEKVKEVLDLKNDLISTRDLNAELQSYIDDLKAQLGAQEKTLNSQHEEIQGWTLLINAILTVLLRFVDGESSRALQQARDKSTSLNTKLNVVKLAVNELGNRFDVVSTKWSGNSDEKVPLPQNNTREFAQKLASSREVELELRQFLGEQSKVVTSLRSEMTSLQHQHQETIQFSGSLKKLLHEKRGKITELNERILELETQLEDVKDFRSSDADETQLWKDRLTIVKTNHSKELERLHLEIDTLKSSVNTNQDQELSNRQEMVAQLNNEITLLNRQLLDKTNDKDSLILNLQTQLQRAKDDYTSLINEYSDIKQDLKHIREAQGGQEKEYRRKLEHAAKDLNHAVTKQRTLAAEKSKLTFALEDVKREREILNMNNTSLSEKVGRLSYQISTFTNYEVGFKSLFELQSHHLQNMLDDFETVLEKSSYLHAKQKLDKLQDSNLDFEKTHAIVRSLLAFFENAMGSLIEDYRHIMNDVPDEELSKENEDLKKQVDTLQDELQWYYDNANANRTDKSRDQSSRTNLRISDLEKKRKAERERRKLEFDESQKLVSKLEDENRTLKERLERLVRK